MRDKKTQLYFCVAPRNNSNFVRIKSQLQSFKVDANLPRSHRDGAFLLYVLGALVEAQLRARFFHNMHTLLTSSTVQIPKK